MPLRMLLKPDNSTDKHINSPTKIIPTHLWILPIPDNLQTPPVQFSEMLSPKERERMSTMGSAERRLEYTASHALLRIKAASALGLKPGGLPLIFEKGGRPLLEKTEGCLQPLHISLSHTKGFAVCALSPHLIGIDIEKFRETSEQTGVARKYFTKTEFEAFDRLTGRERLKRFFQIWTIGEAFYKAGAKSVSDATQWAMKTEISLDGALEFKPIFFEKDSTFSPHHWQLFQMSPSPDHILTMVVGTMEAIHLIKEEVSPTDLVLE